MGEIDGCSGSGVGSIGALEPKNRLYGTGQSFQFFLEDSNWDSLKKIINSSIHDRIGYWTFEIVFQKQLRGQPFHNLTGEYLQKDQY